MSGIPAEPAAWRLDLEISAALQALAAGPPYPFRRDGMSFANREGLLPAGRYREFTVRTSGAAGRGPRRLIIDETSGRLYLTRDHYQSFSELKDLGGP